MSKTEKGVFFILLFFQIFLLFIFVFFRYIDADEGIYLTSASLVKQGELPYLDFFYPQMPLFPFLYSFIANFGMNSLFWGRMLSAFLSLTLGIILFFFAKSISGRATYDDQKLSTSIGGVPHPAERILADPYRISLALLFLFILNGFLLTWQTVIKTYSFSTFFCFLSFIFFTFAFIKQSRTNFYFFLTGLFLGLAFSLRLIFFPLFLLCPFLIFSFSKRKVNRKILQSLIFILGFLLSSALVIYFLFSSPSVFIFENFTYHKLWGEKIVQAQPNLLFSFFKFVFFPQNLIIILFSIFSLLLILRKRLNSHLPVLFSLLFALTIIFSYLLVRPAQPQYYVQALPFLIFASAPAWAYLFSKLQRNISKILVWFLGIVYLLSLLPILLIFVFTLREKDKFFQISEVKKVVALVQKNSKENDQILSSWPGYVVFSKRNSIKGAETVGYEVVKFLKPQEIDQLKLLSFEKLKEKITNRQIPLIVGKEGILDPLTEAIKENYQPIDSVNSVVIYKPKE